MKQTSPAPSHPNASTSKGKGTRNGKLKAKPIMIYPASPEERRKILDAAAKVGGRRVSVSAFVMDSMLKIASEVIEGNSAHATKTKEAPRAELLSQKETDTAFRGVETPEQRAFRLTENLRGLLKKELAEYGGAEGFMRWIRSDEEPA